MSYRGNQYARGHGHWDSPLTLQSWVSTTKTRSLGIDLVQRLAYNNPMTRYHWCKWVVSQTIPDRSGRGVEMVRDGAVGREATTGDLTQGEKNPSAEQRKIGGGDEGGEISSWSL